MTEAPAPVRPAGIPVETHPSGGRRRLLVLLGGVIVVWALCAPVALLVARHTLAQGAHEMRSAENVVRAGDAQRAPRRALENVRGYVEAAHRDFLVAHLAILTYGPVLRRLGWVPSVGNQLAAAPDAAAMADQASDGIVHLVLGLQPLLTVFGHAGGKTHVPVPLLVRTVAREQPQFVDSCRLLHQAQQTRRSVQAGSVSSLASSLAIFDRRLPQLVTLCDGLQLLPSLMGYQHPQRYLIAYQNENELRAAGGFIGSAGFLTLHDGNVKQEFLGTEIKDNLSFVPPQPVELLNDEPGWLFRDSNWSPDFPTSAALERFFAKLDLRKSAPGVINVTQQAVADILSATGPMYSPEYHRWITAGNVAQLTDYFTHDTEHSGPFQFRNADLQRKQFILIVARHLIEHLKQLSLTQLMHLGNQIGASVQHRDIQVNFTVPRQQALIRQLGAAGEMNSTPSDYLYVVNSNISYNKINPWVHMTVSYRATIQTTRWIQGDVTLTFRNEPAPKPLQAGRGPGYGRLGGWDDYGGFVRIYVPAGAELMQESGWTQPWSPGPAYGKTMFSGYIIVRRGQTRSVRLRYVVPPNVFAWSGGRRYRLVVQHQPGSHPESVSVTAVDRAGTTRTWTTNRPITDWTINAPIRRLPIRTIPLSAPQYPVVSPGHWIEPHAYLGVRNRNG